MNQLHKIILTEKQKEHWVREDFANGRIHAMNTVDSSDDIVLEVMYQELCRYENFGSGDEVETKLWTKILKYLKLEEAYEKYWEDAL